MLIGDKTQLSQKTKPVPKLQQLVRRYINQWPKIAWNAITAGNSFLARYNEWKQKNNYFQNQVAVEGNDFCQSFVFYSTPEYSQEIQRMLLFLLDTHHLLVNSRALVCSKGIPDRNIQRKAWQAVAKSNSTDLNIAMVDDLLDKQSNAMAKITYSQEVEDKMKQLHFDKEAELCHLMRNWYEAEDEPSITADE